MTTLGKVQESADTLGNTKVEVRTTLEGNKEVEAGLEVLKQKAESLERGTITLTTRLEGNEEVIADLLKIEGVTARMDGDVVHLTVQADGTEESRVALEQIEATASRIDGDEVRLRVEVDGLAESTTELEAFDTLRGHIDGNDINVDFNLHGAAEATAEVAAFEGASNSMKLAGEAVTAMLGRQVFVWTAIVAAIGFASAAITPLLGGLGILGGLVSAAGIGVGILAGGAVDLGIGLKAVDEANKKVNDTTTKLASAQQELNDALASGDEAAIAEARKDVESATKELAFAESNLTSVTEKQGSAVAELYAKWQELKTGLKGLFDPVAQSLAGLGVQLIDLTIDALPDLGTTAEDVAKRFSRAFERVLAIFQSGALKNSFTALLEGAGPILAQLTIAAGKLTAALVNIFAQGTPLAIEFAQKINDIFTAFLKWTESAEGTAQIQAAMEQMVPIAQALWDGLVKIGGALLEIGVHHGPQVATALTGISDIVTGLIRVFDGLWTAGTFVADNLDVIAATTVAAVLLDIGPAAGIAAAGIDVAAASLVAGAIAAGEFMLALLPLIGLAIIIDIAINFDMAAARQAYTDARASGETVGNSVAEGVLAGLDAVPIVGSVARWIDTNIAQPIANFVQKLEPGGEFDGILGRWLAEQTGIDIPAVADWIDRNIRTPIDDFFANFQSDGQWNGILGDWAMEEFGGIRDAVNEQFTNGAVADFIAADASLGDDATIKWDEVNAKIGEVLTAIWQDVTNSYQDGAIADFIAADASLGDDVSIKWDEVNTKIGEVLAAIWADVTASYQDGAIADFIAADASLGDDVNVKWDEVLAKIGDVLASIWNKVIESYQDGAIADFIAADASLGDDVNAVWPDIQATIVSAMSSIYDAIVSKITSARDVFVNAINVMKGAAASVMTGLGMGNLARSIGLSGAGGGGTANMPAQNAKGYAGEAQGSTGGVASGLTPRVVYGEQQRRVKEAYIVEDRPDNLPYLQEAASWYGMGLYPVEGMARGGVRHHRHGRKGGRGGSDIGKKWNQVKHFGGGKKKRKKKGRRGGSGTGTTAGGTTGGGTTTTTNTSADTASSDSLNQSVDSSGTPTSGGTNQCGVFPVSSATPSDQVPFADAARDQFGLTSVPANPSTTGADHVNVPTGIPGGDLCGANGGGSVPSTFPSNPMTPSGSSGTSTDPWQQCGPSFAMASGGVMGADGAVRPIPYTSVPLDPWRQFLGLSWYGDPTLDWPELVPPAGYDPTQLYGDPSSPTMPFAKGGILRNGTRYFQAGGLNQAQMDAGLAAGNSALGAFYSYGSAGEDGGYDCAGIWNYIESAIVYGAPQTGKRWGTYDAAAGAGGSFTTPGLSPGGANIGVNLSGEGGPDDTHMAGDILNTPFESDSYNGVHNGRGADSFGTQYTMGGAADMASQLPAPAAVDPAGNIQGEVGDWWNCATQPAMPTGSSPTSSPINPWDSALPGMAQDYLTNVGMGTIGSLGGGAAPTGSGVRDWIIAALNASGMDASEEAIATLEGLIMQESGGDPSATSPDGAMGIAQLMPDTWAAYNQGGDPYEPVANIVASIAYQLARYGTLVEFSPYAKGGMATGPHLGLLGETGNNEVMLPLGHKRVMSEVQATVGTAGLTEGLMALGDEIRAVKSELAHQTKVMPERTGVAVGGGMDRRIARNPGTRIAFDRQQDTRDKINNYRGTPV